MKKSLLLSKLLTENTYSTHEIDVHGFTHVFAYPDPKGHETGEGLNGRESKDRANREVRFVDSAAKALKMARSYPVNEGPLSGRVGNYDYQNPRSQKDVEGFERKGYVKIDKRSPSFRYKDDGGDYTPMNKRLDEVDGDGLGIALEVAGELAPYVIERSIKMKDYRETYSLEFDIEVPVSRGYTAAELQRLLYGNLDASTGVLRRRVRAVVRRSGNTFIVKVLVSGRIDT